MALWVMCRIAFSQYKHWIVNGIIDSSASLPSVNRATFGENQRSVMAAFSHARLCCKCCDALNKDFEFFCSVVYLLEGPQSRMHTGTFSMRSLTVRSKERSNLGTAFRRVACKVLLAESRSLQCVANDKADSSSMALKASARREAQPGSRVEPYLRATQWPN